MSQAETAPPPPVDDLTRQRIVVLDFGSQYAQLIARRVREQHVYCQILRHDIDADRLAELRPQGIILSGGPASVYEHGAPRCDPRLFELGIPVLGICYGMQLACEALGGRVDHAHHGTNAYRALTDALAFARAVEMAERMTDPDETLIIVTADHGHVFNIAGYPRRGNPILGKVIESRSGQPALDADGKPYTTLGYMNGRGFRDYGDDLEADLTYREDPVGGRVDLSRIDTARPGFHQEALVPLSSETHGGEDVGVYATGPGSRAATGVQEQNRLFHIMLQATTWEQEAAARSKR